MEAISLQMVCNVVMSELLWGGHRWGGEKRTSRTSLEAPSTKRFVQQEEVLAKEMSSQIGVNSEECGFLKPRVFEERTR